MNTEILINASLVTHDGNQEFYEFVLGPECELIECVKVDPMAQSIIKPIEDIDSELMDRLFELNHVRVNPRVNNDYIIERFTNALNNIGVEVKNQPHQNSMGTCFKPLGEISDNVRFYFNKNRIIFLSPSSKPKLVISDRRKPNPSPRIRF